MHWAFKNCFEHHYYETKKQFTCLYCGNIWDKDHTPDLLIKIDGCTCPKCHNVLKGLHGKEQKFKENEYFCVITTFQEFQVLRYFFVRAWTKKGELPDLSMMEVIQHWIAPDGKREVMSRKVFSQSMYYDQWIWGSDFEIREGSHDRYYPNNTDVYPNTRYIPEIIRNGFIGEFHGISPIKFFSFILGSPRAETLLKTEQFNMLKYFTKNSDEVLRYWPQIKICIRRNYRIMDPGMWIDHLEILEYFHKDIYNPVFICPKNLREEHGILVRKKRKIEHAAEAKRDAEERKLANLVYQEQKQKFFDLYFTNGLIHIVVLKSIEEFIEEGDELDHCVFENGYYKKADKLILSARKDSQRLETISISLIDMKVEQSRGYDNQDSDYHKEILNLINSNLKTIKKLVAA
jgi:hypothetical protein